MIVLKTQQELAIMREAGRIVAEVLAELSGLARPGVTTHTLDSHAEQMAGARNGRPAFKGYSGYPFSLCCSVNNQVVHGFPTHQPLQDGDLLSLDFGVVFRGYYADAAVTVPLGVVSPTAARLLEVTERSLYLAIDQARPGKHLSDVSHAVQKHVEAHGFSVVRDFVGHGIGRALHEAPQVPNFGLPGRGVRLKAGMVLAIEPMINELDFAVEVLEDGWTAVTCDGGLSAHFEHTVAITAHGPEILTRL